jgi:alanine racemase
MQLIIKGLKTKLVNRYVLNNHVSDIILSYRIGVGHIVEVYGQDISTEVIESIYTDSPYPVYIYDTSN